MNAPRFRLFARMPSGNIHLLNSKIVIGRNYTRWQVLVTFPRVFGKRSRWSFGWGKRPYRRPTNEQIGGAASRAERFFGSGDTAILLEGLEDKGAPR